VAMSQTAFDLHGGFGTYKAKFEALLSAHYTAAIILHDRALTLAQFEPECYDNPKLRAFAAQKVEIYADPAVKGSQAKVDVMMDDGATFAAACEHPLGSFENPLSRGQIEQKFRTYAAGVLSNADADAVVKAVDRLEDFGSISTLMDLLRTAPRAMAAAE